MATPISINSIDKEKQSQSDSSNNNCIRELVKQRLTFNKSFINNIVYSKKNVYIGFRVSIDYLEKLDFIAGSLRTRNLSETIRESIDIVYGLLSGSKNIEAGTVVIQNPIVNIVKAESKAESKTEVENNINIDLSDILAELDEIKKLVYNWYRLGKIPKAAFDTVSEKLKKIQKQLKVVN